MTKAEREIDCAEVVATHRIEHFRQYNDPRVQECDKMAKSDPVHGQRLWNLYISEGYYELRGLPVPPALVALRAELKALERL
jgi:hypothetical protein